MAKKEENIFEKFYLSYTLDLASAFWIFGVIFTAIVGLIFGYLSEAIHHWLILPYYYVVIHTIIALSSCTGKYIKEKEKKKAKPCFGLSNIYLLWSRFFGFDL